MNVSGTLITLERKKKKREMQFPFKLIQNENLMEFQVGNYWIFGNL